MSGGMAALPFRIRDVLKLRGGLIFLIRQPIL
jgi:hypothetical protein